MRPLLAHIYEPHRVTYPCFVQPKLNGIRALYQNGRFQSRDELPFPELLLRHLSDPLLQIFGISTILDGELYVHGWPLQRINAAVTPVRQTPTEDTLKVEYHVFDVMDFGKSFASRADIILNEDWPTQIKPVRIHLCTNENEANWFYSEVVSQGYEGMMYRLGDCPYTVPKQETVSINGRTSTGGYFCEDGIRPAGRTKFWSDKDNRCWHLLKRKDWQDDEFECVGVVEGEGKLKGTLGALECGIKSTIVHHGAIALRFRAKFNVGSGLTDAERNHYWANPPIGRLVKVKYLVLSSDGIPLNPTILAIL